MSLGIFGYPQKGSSNTPATPTQKNNGLTQSWQQHCQTNNPFTGVTQSWQDWVNNNYQFGQKPNPNPNAKPTANQAPTAVNDQASTPAGQSIAINVLGNDSDPENDVLTVQSFAQPENGTVTQNKNGELVYTPNPGFSGTDSFNYTITDGNGNTSTATATVNVEAPKNTTPTAANDSSSTEFNSPVSINVLGNDSDPDGDTLSVEGFTQPANGTVTQGENGELVYTPNPGFVGNDSFTYTVSDGNGGTATATAAVNVAGPKNTTPTAANDSSSTEFNSPVSINVLGNDSDPDGDTLSVEGFTQPANGTVTQGENGELVYTPNPGFVGNDSFTYTVSDGNGGTATATAAVNVAGPKNTTPTAANDSSSTEFNSPVSINVLGNDSDPDGDTLSVEGFTQPANGTVTQGENGELVYTPNPGFVGNDSFTYTVSDGNGGTATATAAVNVAGPKNTAPTAANDSSSTEFNSPVSINVLGNDSDPDGDTLSVEGFTQPANGTVTQGENGELVYTPNPGFVGNDSFTYTVSDGNGGTATATAAVNVAGPKNTAPTAANDSSSTEFNSPVSINVLGNDSDPDGDTLSVEGFTQPANGTVTQGENGELVYTPNPGFVGNDSFTYTVSDGNGGTATATAAVNVAGPKNTAPTAANDSSSTEFNSPVSINVLGNDSDPDGDTLSVEGFTQPANGTVTQGENGELVYTPNPGFVGNDSFTYTVSDGNGGTATATAAVNVAGPKNTTPTAANDSSSTEFNSPVSINVLGNDTDADGDALTVDGFTQPANGTVTQGENGELVYTPNPGFVGNDSFTYTVSDGNGGTATATAAVNVAGPKNTAPDAVNDSATTLAGSPVDIAVLGNDSDVDGDAVSIEGFTQPSNGIVMMNDQNELTYIPFDDFVGTDTFTYTISDGKGGTSTATATVEVQAPPNTAPVSADDAANADHNSPVSINVLGNDTDADGDALTVDGFTQPANGTVTQGENGELVYTPNPGFSGDDTFTYTVSDGNGGTSTSTATVSVAEAPNTAPVSYDDTATADHNSPVSINVLGNDTDADGDALTVDGFTQPANGTVTQGENGELVYTPNPGFSGDDTFTYTVSDGNGGTSTSTATVHVAEAPNTAPVGSDDTASTEHGAPVSINVLGNDTDADGDALTVDGFTQPANGTVTQGENGELVYTPNPGFSGDDTFTYTVSDGNGGTSTANATVHVAEPKNNAPDAVNDSATTLAGSPVDIAVLGNDSDVDGDAVSIEGFTQPSNGIVMMNDQNELTYIPFDDFVGTDTFTYTISDGKGGTSTATATVEVQAPPNTAPVSADDAATADHNSPVSINVLGNDTDADGDALTVDGFTQPANGTVTQGENGELVYTPNPGFSGDDTFTYTVSDGNGGTSTSTATVSVAEAPNTVPVSYDDTATADHNSPVSINVLGNDTDADGDALTVDGFTQPANGTVTQGENGELVYTPNPGFSGDDTFTYTVSDGNGGTSTSTATVSVAEAPNTAPVSYDDTATADHNSPVSINVLGNDTDADGDALTVDGFTQPANGTVTQGENGELVYTPNPGFSGDDTFTYTVSDGNGGTSTSTATVSVAEAPNTAPVSYDDTATADHNSPVSINVLGNDTDADGDALTVDGFTQPANGTVTQGENGELVYTPNPGFSGDDTFTYTVSDGNGGTSTATATVHVAEPKNNAPDAVNDSATTLAGSPVDIAVLGNDSDVDGDAVSIEGFTQPSNGIVMMNDQNELTYIPFDDFVGTDTFTYTISDGKGGTSTATATVEVQAPPNTAPVSADDAANADHNSPVSINVLGNDTDADGDALTVDGFTQPANGTVTQGENGELVYTPNPGFSGDDTFTYTVSDGNGGTSTSTATVSVAEAPNTAPVSYDDTATADHNSPVSINVLGNDTDADGDALTVDGFTQPANGTVTQGENGELVYTPNPGFSGDDTFTYTVSDGNGGTSTSTATVHVAEAPNSPPTAVEDAATTDVNNAVTLNVTANDTDPDGDDLNVSHFTQGENGSVALNDNGELVYTPNPGFTGTDYFYYTVDDGRGGESRAIATVTVEGEQINVIHGDCEEDQYGELIGTEGVDHVFGAVGNETINTLGGDDYIAQGQGNDTVNAGAGDDWIVYTSGNDVVDGGEGNDVVQVLGKLDDFSVSMQNDSVVLTSNQTGETLTMNNIEHVIFGEGESSETYTIAQMQELAAANPNPNPNPNPGSGDATVFTGTAEADYFNEGAGDYTINAGAGNDWAVYQGGNVQLNGEAGSDVAQILGSLSDYAVSQQNDSLVLTHNATSESLTLGSDVENIVFGDGAEAVVYSFAELLAQATDVINNGSWGSDDTTANSPIYGGTWG